MGDRRSLSGGLAGSCKSAHQGLGLPASEPDAQGTPRPYLPPKILRLIDALARAMERAERLRAMHGGNLGRTLVEAAVAGGLLDVRFLLAADVDAGAEGGLVLIQACFRGHVRVAEALLDVGSKHSPWHRNVALYKASSAGRTACCELLLERGSYIHYGLDAALYLAAQEGHLETVAFLLDRGADAWSEAAMQYATDNHHEAVVALLLARRANGAAQ